MDWSSVCWAGGSIIMTEGTDLEVPVTIVTTPSCPGQTVHAMCNGCPSWLTSGADTVYPAIPGL